MLDEGYAAATSRRVAAAKAGLKAALVQNYFPSIDDVAPTFCLAKSA
jgi:hypothetical protein